MTKKQKRMVVRLVISAACFVTAIVMEHKGSLAWVPYILAYLSAGYDIPLKALRNIKNGQVFDENFLMTVATFGAIAVGSLEEAVAVMLFYQVGELFNDYAVNKSRRSIQELMDINPEYANLLRDGVEEQVDPYEVEIGDTIVIRPGEKVPLDGVVLRGDSSLDTKALTGESMPVEVSSGSNVVSGSINLNGVLEVRTTKLFDDSTVAKILELVENASSRKAKAETFITRFARVYTPIVVVLALLLAILMPLVSGGGWGTWVYRACSFLVVSCPCALVISVPLSFFGGLGAASKNGILLKGSNYLEAMAKLDTVVFDKTGTLTNGRFEVSDVAPVHGEREALLELAALGEYHSTHPIAMSVKKAYGKEIDTARIGQVEEIPGHGIHARAQAGGAWHELFIGNRKLMERQQVIIDTPSAMMGTTLYLADETGYLGAVVISDRIREDVPAALAGLRRQGVGTLVMLTGDREEVGKAVAGKLGLDEVFGNLLPGDKVARVEALLKKKPLGKTLAFVGDGINDAPVLARADVGIAMGGIGSDAAVEAADVVIMDDEPSKIVDTVCIARKTMGIVRQNIFFAIGIKVLVLALVALGYASMWAAVFGDVGVSVLAILNAVRALSYGEGDKNRE
ncbi:MAG: cadmium-translocating P-type ATPase [Lachnospiraceae bacterium]|nr:cadmium-translocating P-type ATPase [Lachnospiraceae bacterium]